MALLRIWCVFLSMPPLIQCSVLIPPLTRGLLACHAAWSRPWAQGWHSPSSAELEEAQEGPGGLTPWLVPSPQELSLLSFREVSSRCVPEHPLCTSIASGRQGPQVSFSIQAMLRRQPKDGGWVVCDPPMVPCQRRQAGICSKDCPELRLLRHCGAHAFPGNAQLGKMVSGGAAGKAANDLEYEQTTGMLRSLGLEKYEKNFKKGLLSDRTLPLLSDRFVSFQERQLVFCSIPLWVVTAPFQLVISAYSFVCPWALHSLSAVRCKR